MKLLIVDDEKLTREGLKTSINWDSLGVFKLLEADDGLNALSVAKAEHPDIVLCDVRMPRMTGIQFVERLRELQPDISIIFMSGYSDKEYLKAAIKLKAVQYVEKPLNPLEVEDAILTAKEERLFHLKTLENVNLDLKQKETQLALCLTKPYGENEALIHALIKDLDIPFGLKYTTYIVKVNSFAKEDILPEFNRFLDSYHGRVLHVNLHDSYHVFHVFREKEFTKQLYQDVENFLMSRFKHFGIFYIGRGSSVTGEAKVFQSYAACVAIMQSSFFFSPGTLLTPLTSADEQTEKIYTEAPITNPENFENLLLEKNEEGVHQMLDRLYAYYHENNHALPSQAKGFYFRLFTSIKDVTKRLSLPVFADNSSVPANEETIMETLENVFTFDSLHGLLTQGVNEFFESLKTLTPEDSTIYLIKDYISHHYGREDLSIKEISDHAFLSVSYMCTYFKNLTGKTINQFLTDYRMEKAMQLLKDKRNPITDISAKVGYSNSNYFSKSFKKYTGVTPSKYREELTNEKTAKQTDSDL